MLAADLLLLNGRILTMAGRAVSALAAIGDRVVAVGEDRELLPLRGPRTRVANLAGRLALPGFTDSHIHLAALARRLSQVDLSSARSLREALGRVAARARATRKGEWITGGRFDKNQWAPAVSSEAGFPTRHDLDRVTPNHPVALHSRDGHSMWLNSLGLCRCGVTKRTRPPRGGVIMRDPRGEPTGILQERATALVCASPAFEPPAAGPTEMAAALRLLRRQGITSTHIMEEIETFGAIQELRERNQLPVRVTIYRGAGELDDLIRAGLRSGFGDEWLRLGGIKLLIDGSLGSQTAWLLKPYRRADFQSASPAGSQPAAFCGIPVLYGKELRAIVSRAHQAGLACAIHAIGDRANAEALEAIEGALAAGRGNPALQHRIEHAQLVRPQDIPRFAQLGVVASMQPCHIPGDIITAERHWGRRSRWAYPIASLARHRVSLAFGSDAPVETSNPVDGIYAAVERRTWDGQPPGGWYRKQEGISVAAALRAYTIGPALASGESALKGRLLPGNLADIVVLSHEVTRVRGRALLAARPDMVFVEGRLCHRRRRK